MSPLTSYDLAGGIATIAMDDGKANALSAAMLAELSSAFERAEADGAIVLLTGRERTFSGGFDLRCEPAGWPEMVGAGARLAERILSVPHPVVAACNGNAIAMAGFLLLAADVRIGAAGGFKLGLNEVAIGLAVPYFGVALAHHRLARPYADRCLVTGALLGPQEARAAAQRLGGGPVVVKAQVKSGGRGKAGGVKLAKDPQEAQERAREILGVHCAAASQCAPVAVNTGRG